MWVFGYGSLMWDQWEQQFGGSHVDGASLVGYRRSFNKASTRNWGTRNSPAPTLGLEPSPGRCCIGTAFQFPEETADAVKTYLRNREGASFTVTQLPVRLPNEQTILAFTPVNDRNSRTYLGHLPIGSRVALARTAAGTDGICADYVRNIHRKLTSLHIVDADVEEFVALLDSSVPGTASTRNQSES
jgi:cation transport protein ChaC